MALSADTPRQYEGDPKITIAPVDASATIYEGALLSFDATSGFVSPAATTEAFAGVALRPQTGSSTAGERKVEVAEEGKIVMPVAGADAQDHVGDVVYLKADDTLSLTAGSDLAMGKVHRWISGTTCVVSFKASNLQ